MNFKQITKTLAITVITLFMLSSCNNDDDNGSSTSIIGTWKMVSATVNGIDDTDECDLLSTVSFTDTQITTVDYYGNNCDSFDSNTGNYSVNNSTLTLTYSDETFVVQIETLNATTLAIKEVMGNQTYIATFERQ